MYNGKVCYDHYIFVDIFSPLIIIFLVLFILRYYLNSMCYLLRVFFAIMTIILKNSPTLYVYRARYRTYIFFFFCSYSNPRLNMGLLQIFPPFLSAAARRLRGPAIVLILASHRVYGLPILLLPVRGIHSIVFISHFPSSLWQPPGQHLGPSFSPYPCITDLISQRNSQNGILKRSLSYMELFGYSAGHGHVILTIFREYKKEPKILYTPISSLKFCFNF